MNEHREAPLREGDVVSSRIDEQGVLRTEVVENGEIRGHDYDREGIMRDGVYYPPPPITEDILPAPIPVEIAIAPVNELDAIVHAMAVEAEGRAGPIIEAEPVLPTEVSTSGAFTVMEYDQYGDLREHTYDFEPVIRAVPAESDSESASESTGTVDSDG